MIPATITQSEDKTFPFVAIADVKKYFKTREEAETFLYALQETTKEEFMPYLEKRIYLLKSKKGLYLKRDFEGVCFSYVLTPLLSFEQDDLKTAEIKERWD